MVKGQDETSAATIPYKYGWQEAQTEEFEVAAGDQVTVKAYVDVEQTAWWGADRFCLTYLGDNTSTSIQENIVQIKNKDNKSYNLNG